MLTHYKQGVGTYMKCKDKFLKYLAINIYLFFLLIDHSLR